MGCQNIKLLLLATVSIASFLFTGSTHQNDLSVNAQENSPTVQPQESTPTQQRERIVVPDVPYVPTPPEVVDKMLEVAKVTKDDVLYDLGSGDGRIVITAAKKYGTRGVGIDINPIRVQEAQENAKKAGVTDLVTFLEQDLYKTDLRNATVVTLYLLPRVNLEIRPKLLRELKPGTRIVSHQFDMGTWKPDRVITVKYPIRDRTIYYWVVPKNGLNN